MSNCLIIILNLLEPVLVISSLSSAKPMKKQTPNSSKKNKIKKIKEELTIFFFKDGYKTEQVPMMMDFTER